MSFVRQRSTEGIDENAKYGSDVGSIAIRREWAYCISISIVLTVTFAVVNLLKCQWLCQPEFVGLPFHQPEATRI
jgi:hypothetical protein